MDAEDYQQIEETDMSHWQNLTIEERQVILNNVARVENLPPAAIEKDWWVTSVLNAVFRTDAASNMLFKDGTSLSKAWHIIERLSEDVDLAIDHSFFGVNSTNKTQRDKLRKLSRKYIMETLAEQLDRNLSEMGMSGYTIERVTSTDSGTPIDSDKDPTVILVNYESVCNDRVGYILPRVKVEISCLSMSEPSEEMPIESLISKSYPAEDSSTSCRVKTVLPSRTFLEKAFLLNEEFQKEKPRSLRMSRHLYDMYLLKDTGFGREALTDTDLYETIVKHRSLYYVDKRVDYNRHHPSLINFCPPDKVVDAWKSDYANMLESFIYGKAPSFDELMESMKSLLDDFRRVKVKDNILE